MITNVDYLELDRISPFSRKNLKLNLTKNALGDEWQIPIMIIKGDIGPTLGITAAIHGNELNGIPTIHKLWEEIDPNQLHGTLLLAPVINSPGFLQGIREFYDGKDLNRLMPGKKNGSSSDRYAYEIIDKLASHFDFHFDLHTASQGRINSYYVKANLHCEQTQKLAYSVAPQIIVNTPGIKGSFRGASEKMGTPAITLELGDPNIFQMKHIKPAYLGILHALIKLGMITNTKNYYETTNTPEICQESKWLYTKFGGILTVYPQLTDRVKKGEVIGLISDIFGNEVHRIIAHKEGIVIGKANHPVCQEGSRIIHLGFY